MISVTEIVLIVAGFVAIILGYLLPAGKELDEEDKMLMEREIRELVRREVEDQKETIENMVDDTVDNSLDRTERAMERISNEKLSAIGEYSDTVINDIHKNHDEVMFMYDMLNDKHKNLTSVVSEVTKKADEARQAVIDAQDTLKGSEAYKTAKEENVKAIFIDTDKDKLSGIHIPYKEKVEEHVAVPNQMSGLERLAASNNAFYRQDPVPRTEPIAKATIGSGYVDESNLKELKELSEIRAEVISAEKAGNLHVIGNTTPSQQPTTAKVVPISDGVKTTVRPQNPDRNMQELTANDPISQNNQIIEMHKAGKSNMVIARELGLGIGEVKLVIDLSNKHRKVK